MEPLETGPLADEMKKDVKFENVRLRPGAKQCKSKLRGIRCMKPVGHGGQHGHQVWRLVSSARWD